MSYKRLIPPDELCRCKHPRKEHAVDAPYKKYCLTCKCTAYNTTCSPMKGKTLLERFWLKVNKSDDGCWEWNAVKNVKGYGQFSDRNYYAGGKTRGAHRWSWEFTYGDIPDGLFVCHRCDNPGCVRPDHLFLGTNSDNQRDSVAKGRAQRRGEQARHVKLNEMQVRVIRRLEGVLSIKKIAKIFDTAPTNVWHIQKRQNWAHI